MKICLGSRRTLLSCQLRTLPLPDIYDRHVCGGGGGARAKEEETFAESAVGSQWILISFLGGGRGGEVLHQKDLPRLCEYGVEKLCSTDCSR